MALLYNIGIRAYDAAIHLAAPFNEKARLWVKGRKGIRQRIAAIPQNGTPLVWFHAASLGEFEQGRPVMETLKRERPNVRILLTFFSPSGYEVRKNYAGADYILYLPLDTPGNARFLTSHIKPAAAVFVKYEFWYHYLHSLAQEHVPVYLISALFRSNQPFFKRWGGLHRKMLTFFTRLFVQDDASVQMLSEIGIHNAMRTGDTRFDRVKQIATQAKDIEKVERFTGGTKAVVCGSTWPPDEALLTDYINHHDTPCKWILTPHEIGESHVRSILSACKKKIVRYTDDSADFASAEVLVIDCIGLLSSIYRYGRIAYIGGGFGVGIHNTIEAAVYGIPVLFGPNYQRFDEAIALIANGGGFTIKNGEELSERLDGLLSQPDTAASAGQKAATYVDSQLGATEVIAAELLRKLARQ